jgi:single-strand DNA-binding protein
MNTVILTGRLTKDPELSYTPSTNTAACRITLAVDRPKRNGDAQGADYVRSADFIRITVWGRQAETCDRYLSKGRQVAVMGRIQTGSYKNKNGETVYTTDVVAVRVEFLGGGQQQSQPQVNTDEVQRQADELLRPKPQQNTQMQMESQLASGFDDLPDTFMAAEDDIPFRQ